ncbi:hypothetical protein C8R45DRAFT_634120 [Mycena sanguinolenta]|nr:hypothetical protein C8R45DRAFT_634120 [Mycena sanguinolenta]
MTTAKPHKRLAGPGVPLPSPEVLVPVHPTASYPSFATSTYPWTSSPDAQYFCCVPSGAAPLAVQQREHEPRRALGPAHRRDTRCACCRACKREWGLGWARPRRCSPSRPLFVFGVGCGLGVRRFYLRVWWARVRRRRVWRGRWVRDRWAEQGGEGVRRARAQGGDGVGCRSRGGIWGSCGRRGRRYVLSI